MRQRSEKELEELAIRIMQTGSKVCPDCGQPALVTSFDEHYWKLKCSSCGFAHTDYMSGS